MACAQLKEVFFPCVGKNIYTWQYAGFHLSKESQRKNTWHNEIWLERNGKAL